MIIRTYGLHWSRDLIEWGKQNRRGRLLGSLSIATTSVAIDFRDQRGIYVLTSGFDIVYIGQTGSKENRLLTRLRQHTCDHLANRWDRFSWFGLRWVTNQQTLSADNVAAHPSTKVLLNQLEAILIAVAEPKLNLQRGRWGDAKPYFQHVASINPGTH